MTEPTTESMSGELVAGVDMTQVLPASVVEPLRHQVAALLASGRPAEKMPELIVTWMAPLITGRNRVIKKLRWLHAEQGWKLNQARARLAADAAELAELREQLAAAGRGLWQLLGELSEHGAGRTVEPDAASRVGNGCAGCGPDGVHVNAGTRCVVGERT